MKGNRYAGAVSGLILKNYFYKKEMNVNDG